MIVAHDLHHDPDDLNTRRDAHEPVTQRMPLLETLVCKHIAIGVVLRDT